MVRRKIRVHVGRRTIKTVVAVVIAMLLVDAYGTTASRITFAMMGAMAAVQPTFKESWESSLTQIIGVLLGALAGVGLSMLPLPEVIGAAIGILIVITFYNALRIPFSPSLSCLIVVVVCTTPDLEVMDYAVGRIWDSAIGLLVGMVINTLVFPYDNSQKIRAAVRSLDSELMCFLEDIFDGDDHFPDAEQMTGKLDDIAFQLNIFANQRLPFKRREQKEQLKMFRLCEGKARQLVSHLEVLCTMQPAGKLSEENRRELCSRGAKLLTENAKLEAETVEEAEKTDNAGKIEEQSERDIVTNYHVACILLLQQELLQTLSTPISKK